jgi:MFS family permease
LNATTIPPSRRAPMRAGMAVRLAIALAFADASVAVLALPQIVVRLHTTISHVTWVITAYNLALIAGTLAVLPVARALASRRALAAGLAVFGLASLGSGAAGSLTMLIVWRCLQGAGGALLLCASLPLIGGRDGDSALRSWATAAAVGAAVGPAAGGLLTQIFDWRAIFLAQAPVAALAIVTALSAPAAPRNGPTPETAAEARPVGAAAPPTVAALPGLSPGSANLGLGLISAGLIGALFIASVLLINVWQVSPLGAAAVLAVIPIATVLTERLAAPRRAAATGRAGAIVLALGLVALAVISHRELVPAVLALALCGVGLGLAFPALTRVALSTRGTPVARAARTVAAREGGLVLGLVLLTPILVSQLKDSTTRATPPIVRAILPAPNLTIPQKVKLGGGLIAAAAKAPESELPNLGPAFTSAAVGVSAAGRAELVVLRPQIDAIVQRAATRSFRTPLLLCAALSLLSIPALSLGGRRSPKRQRRGPGGDEHARADPA